MHKQSLFQISKRDALPLPKALAIRGGILLLALIFCGLITTLLTGKNPISVYGTILSGAFGNCIDRIRLNYVVDFLYFKLINFPIFNVADIYVTVAAFLLVILILIYYKEDDLERIFH